MIIRDDVQEQMMIQELLKKEYQAETQLVSNPTLPQSKRLFQRVDKNTLEVLLAFS